MTYEIKRRESRFGTLMTFDVTLDGEDIGTIVPMFKTMNSNRPYAYQTEVWLENDWLADETGYPNEYRTQKEAIAAVRDLMERNGYEEKAHQAP